MRTRITFSKAGPMRFVGHLDLHRSWERTFRRSGLPLEYSQGFHPQPHLNLGCALPLGFTSQCELLDAWLQQDFPLECVGEAISTAVPPGLEIIDVIKVNERAPALQSIITSMVYIITFLDEIPDLDSRIQRINSAGQLARVRRGKSYDLRPLIESLASLPPEGDLKFGLRVQLAARQAATGRPEELLDEMGIKFEDTRIHRQQLLLTTD